jgi:AcrR family transcriptional regulator
VEVPVSVAVEHEKRKKEILENALDVFVEEGYADTTFQKIADRCGITRTILYIYFKNKREVFMFSIKRFTEKLEAEIREASSDESSPSYQVLDALGTLAISRCAEQAKLLSVIVGYIQHSRKSGGSDTGDRIRRRTIRMRHIISGVVIRGQKSGELRRVPVGAVSDFFYGLIEAAIFRAAVLGMTDTADLQAGMRLFFEGLRAHDGR